MIYRYISNFRRLFFWLMVSMLIGGVVVSAFSKSNLVSARSLQQTDYANDLDRFIQTQMQTYRIPGLALAIVREGEVEYIQGYGVANPDGDLITPDTPFLLASLSKSITALGVMQLVEVGKINLDDPVQKYLPWFEVDGAGAEKIRVGHLVYHTSGFSEVGGRKQNLRPDGTNALEEGVRDLAKERLNFSPGNGWKYSNLNYTVLGLLIQEVSGQRYERYIQENIFEPLGMKGSFTTLASARAGNAASGYYPFFGTPRVWDEQMPYTAAVTPAAGLWSSVADLSGYLIAQLNEGKSGSARVLSAASLEKLQTPGVEIEPGYNYAMGWFHAPNLLDPQFLQTLNTDLEQYADLQVLWHEGDWANYKSIALMLPGLDYGVVLLMNSNDPTVSSVFRYFAWDVTLIANGGEAYYFQPDEGFLVRNARWIFSALILLLLGGLVWSIILLRKRRKTISPSRGREIQAGLSLLISAGLLAYLYLKFLPDNAANIPILLSFAPDIGVLVILVSLIALSWSAVNVWLLMRARKS